MSMPSTCGNNVSVFFCIVDTSNHGPANRNQGLAAVGALPAHFKRSNKAVVPGINFIFNGKDLLPFRSIVRLRCYNQQIRA